MSTHVTLLLPLPGLDAFPSIPGSVVIDILRVVREAARQVPDVDPSVDSVSARLEKTLRPLATALQDSLGWTVAVVYDTGGNAPVFEPEVKTEMARVWTERPELSLDAVLAAVPAHVRASAERTISALQRAVPPHARDQRVRFFDLYIRFWNEAANLLTGTRGRKERTETTPLLRSRFERRCAELEAAFAREDAAVEGARFIPDPARDELALRHLAYQHVLEAERRTGYAWKLPVSIPQKKTLEATRANETADTLARALVQRIDQAEATGEEAVQALLAKLFPTNGAFERWAIAAVNESAGANVRWEEGSVKRKESKNRNDDTIRRALRSAGVIKSGDKTRTSALAWANRLLDRARAAGWYRPGQAVAEPREDR